ncbi:hypothetical protein EIP86_008163 [Pleurotus ostreatoroseus]|nr:hypothetical protein EIP86_008163 [Pleurotus ostreatoroseus]
MDKMCCHWDSKDKMGTPQPTQPIAILGLMRNLRRFPPTKVLKAPTSSAVMVGDGPFGSGMNACRPSLDLDILLSVMPWIASRKDVFSFMLACKILYLSGIPIYLSFKNTISDANVGSFYSFLRRYVPFSFSALRHLVFYITQNLDGVVSMLTDILKRGQNIQYILIHGHTLDKDFAIYRAIDALPALKTLDISNCYDDPEYQPGMLFQLRSPLTQVAIGRPGYPGHGNSLAVLAHSAQTLQKATLYLGLYSLPFTASRLTDLSLTSATIPELSVLLPAFPQLQYLLLEFSGRCSEAQEPEVRENNIRFQREHPDQRWTLKSLSGDCRSLYLLGLQTRVPTVKLTGAIIDEKTPWFPYRNLGNMDLRISQLRLSLELLRPLQLSFANLHNAPTSNLCLLFGVTWNDRPGLVRLDFVFAFDHRNSCEYEAQLDAMFSRLEYISRSNPRLTVLSLRFDDTNTLPDSDTSLLNEYIGGLGTRMLMERALDAIPTLELFVFEKEYWMIAKQNITLYSSGEMGETADSIADKIVDRLSKGVPPG